MKPLPFTSKSAWSILFACKLITKQGKRWEYDESDSPIVETIVNTFNDKPRKAEAKEYEPFVRFPLGSDQQAAVDFALEGSGSMAIQALAGAGKTYVIQRIVNDLHKQDPNLSIRVMTFGSDPASELKGKLGKWVHASTFNSYGRSVLRSHEGFRKVNDFRVMNYLRSLPDFSADGAASATQKIQRNVSLRAMNTLTGLAMNTLTDANNEVAVADLMDKYANQICRANMRQYLDQDLIIATLPNVLTHLEEDTQGISFDEMLHAPIKQNLEFPKYDIVIVDEAQDTNAVQLEMVARSVKDGGRVIVVGDPHQSIYGFRSADSNAWENMVSRFNCESLPLNESRRVSKAVADYVNASCGIAIESLPEANEGSIETITTPRFVETVDKDAMPLVRRNADGLDLAFKLLNSGKKAVLVGNDNLAANIIREVCKLAKDGGYESVNGSLVQKIDQLPDQDFERDRLQTVQGFVSRFTTLKDCVESVIEMTTETDDAVKVMTAHKAKGLENDNVFVYEGQKGFAVDFEDMKEWERTQESNLWYVALTRSGDNLRFVRPAHGDSE